MADPTPFRERLALTTAWQDILVVEAGKFAQITFCQVPNVDGVNNVDVSVQWLDGNGVATSLDHLVRAYAKDALKPFSPGLMLLPLDKLQMRASVDSDAVATVSGYFQDMP
jgi:hypothetical protein